MSTARETQVPVVPLEAGGGPENPPCPACGEPLFGWMDTRPGMAGPLSRCESCGLGVVGQPGSTQDTLAELDRHRGGDWVTIANRAGFSAWLGGAGWAGLEPGARYLFTVEAASRLIANRDQIVKTRRWTPGGSILAMWQTVLNGLTFGRNVALGAFGSGEAVVADKPWQRRLDAVISVLAAAPAMVVAVPLELIAAAARRGGSIRLQFELL